MDSAQKVGKTGAAIGVTKNVSILVIMDSAQKDSPATGQGQMTMSFNPCYNG